jgi:hypothetical protein
MKPLNYYGSAIEATPLHYCDTYDEAMVYLEQGWRGDELCKGISPYVYSCDDIRILEECLKRGAKTSSDILQTSTLHSHSKLSFIKLLVSYGADVNYVNWNGSTPLHAAEYLGVIKFLISKGANPNILNNDGLLPGDDYPSGIKWEKMKNYLAHIRNLKKHET